MAQTFSRDYIINGTNQQPEFLIQRSKSRLLQYYRNTIQFSTTQYRNTIQLYNMTQFIFNEFGPSPFLFVFWSGR